MKSRYFHRLELIHITSLKNAEKIIETQKMIPCQGGLFGKGCYFQSTIEQSDLGPYRNATYLIADVYPGKTITITKNDVESGKINFDNLKAQGFNSIIGYGHHCMEFIVLDPERIRNIKYIYGIRPKNVLNINQKRIVLFYVTDKNSASTIVQKQQIPKSNGIFGDFIYMYDTITDAKNVVNGKTFLAADAIVKNCHYHHHAGIVNLPEKCKCFKANYNGATVYGFKHHFLIRNIHYCGGNPW